MKSKTLDADGNVTSKDVSYFENKRVSKREITSYNDVFDDGQEKYLVEFTYDSNNNLIQSFVGMIYTELNFSHKISTILKQKYA